MCLYTLIIYYSNENSHDAYILKLEEKKFLFDSLLYNNIMCRYLYKVYL